MNYEIIKNVNRYITRMKIESIIRSFTTKKSSGLHGFSAEFYQMFLEEPTPILHKLFTAIERKKILPDSFYEGSIALITMLETK